MKDIFVVLPRFKEGPFHKMGHPRRNFVFPAWKPNFTKSTKPVPVTAELKITLRLDGDGLGRFLLFLETCSGLDGKNME